jgi:hypothetical protein
MKLPLFIGLITALSFQACTANPELNEQEVFTIEAIDTLLSISETDNIYLRFIYYGQPPLQNYGVLCLIRYSYKILDITEYKNFAYFSPTQYYQDSFANELYSYRNQYQQLSATQFNQMYNFKL